MWSSSRSVSECRADLTIALPTDHRCNLFLRLLQEGIQYLKDSGEDTLLEMQGLKTKEATPAKPAVPRDGTMVATAKVMNLGTRWRHPRLCSRITKHFCI